MTQREKSMNLKVFLFSAAAISAIASVVYASGIPGIRHPGFPHVPVERIAEETAADVIVIRDPETETETAEIAAESTAAALPETLTENVEPTETQRYNGIREGDTIVGTLTYYDVCLSCCGKTDGITASGIRIKNGVEPEIPVVGCNWLPLMTVLTIDGVEYIVADRGGASMDTVGRLDVFNPAGHEDCIQRGITENAEIVIVDLPEE